ncbi:uncharacterized protein TNCV_1010051 [Trichonephila clavipes]|nr:uncharacterized protein TNCV_1010051 [Trichonephila clavipes]
MHLAIERLFYEENCEMFKIPGKSSLYRNIRNIEIVTSAQEEYEPVDDETEEDEDSNNESSKGLSNADAFSAFETAMKWYEQQSKCCPTQLLLLKRTRDLLAKK